MSTHKKGFTLIELLVVIAIIGLLSSVVFASLNSARAKARDARRLSDLRQINTGIQMYFDRHGFYPICASAHINGTTDCLSVALIGDNIFSKLPVDPTYLGVGANFNYQYYSGGIPNGAVYGLRGMLEGTPSGIVQSHNYPSQPGSYCGQALLPCGWYNTCVYRGYGPSCNLTQAYGSD